ncbi:MAG TPA: CAP domain-containing protein [Caulobacteraceae bacterium]|jgi:Ca2+-binding RTX toxin-like protein|nr:CAP domain-containing protein [Caulobacteraceae bacterium]
MPGPSNDEQYLLELINDARLNPLGDAARYLGNYAPLTSPVFDIQSAINYFGVSGPTLLNQFAALAPVQPVAWNEQLAAAARGHDAAMIAADQQSHQVSGEGDLGARSNAAGYTGWSVLAENVYAYSTGTLYGHAGFMIDWGPGSGGMQDPPGHRDNIMNASLREVGVGIVAETNPATQVGPQVVTEDFGTRFGSGNFILGAAFFDFSGDGFYSPGEGQGTLNVSLAGASAASWASGGYTLQTAATGPQTVVFSGAGLAGAVTAAVNLGSATNAKIDIVNGTELRTSVSAVVAGPVTAIVGLGLQGLSLTATGAGDHRIDGSGGDDIVTGGDGPDFVRGLNGNDQINGGPGNDDVNGNMGADLVRGGAGADYVRGGQGADTVYGDDGDDSHVNGNIGDDVVFGGAGNDTLFGGQGGDSLYGEDGNDWLSGDLGADVLTGGPGADRFLFRPGSGADWVADFSSAAGDRVQLAPGTAYVVVDYQGQAVIDLGNGDRLGLVGVSIGAMGDWLVYA